MEVKLTGRNAVLAVVALVAFGFYRMSSMQTELETEALEELKAYLAAEYATKDVAALSEALETDRPVSDQEAVTRTNAILAAQNISFSSVSARGMWAGRQGAEVIVRIEIQVNGGPPPDGEPVRYYRMRYRGLSGWDVGGRTSAWSYRLKLF